MRRVGKSRSALIALLAAAIALVAMPIPAPAQGPDEYQLNLPDGGNGSTDTSGDTGAPVEETAPVLTAPVPTETLPAAEETEIVAVGGGKDPKPDRPEPVFGTTSLNATLGQQKIPPFKVPGNDGVSPVIPLGLAGLAGLCCLIAVWRLRYLRELPTSPAPLAPTPGPRRPVSDAAARLRAQREAPVSARVRSGRQRPASARARRTRTPRGAASS